MTEKEKRAIKLWVNHTVENLEDIIDNDKLTKEEIDALKMTITILNRRITN